MKVRDIGEFNLIERIRSKVGSTSKDVFKGIGDDCAVLNYDKNNFMLFTTDMVIEDVHFSLEYFSPKQIGMKAIEQNVSDIAAMGGVPKYALVSLSVPRDMDVAFVDKLVDGIIEKSRKYKIEIVGGNVSGSDKMIVDISLIGFVEKKFLAIRKNARKGDLIFLSGSVGESACGLELLTRKKKGKCAKRHLEPKSRIELARELVKAGINCMIDVSDGIISEIVHICKESKTGAIIYANKIPISKNVIDDAKKLNRNPLDFAIYGGEDFELIFTASKKKSIKIKRFNVTEIGRVVDKKKKIKLIKDNKEIELGQGFDHFKE